MPTLLKKHRRDIAAVLWGAMAVFVAFSLFSYNPNDPSFNTLSSNGKIIHNFCGYIGSFLADSLYQAFGLCSWIFVLCGFYVAYQHFQGRDHQFTAKKWVLSLFVVLSYAVLISIFTDTYKVFQGQIYIGGVLGHGLKQIFIQAFNKPGVIVIFTAISTILTLLFTEKSLDRFLLIPRNLWNSGREYFFNFVKEKFNELLTKLKTQKERKATAPSVFISKRHEEIMDHSAEAEIFSEEEEQAPAAQTLTAQPLKKRKVVLKTKVQRTVENWELPNIKMLEDPPDTATKVDPAEIRRKTALLEDKLKQFDVNGKVVGVLPGPAVTLFEYKPNVDVKISNITKLANDLSLALSSESLRIIAPIPGRDVVGIEASNTSRETVYLKEIIADEDFWSEEKALPLALGKQANGSARVVDLRKMPHLMVAGTTGSGKSVFVVSCLTGLLFKHSPKTLRLILIDPKQVDLAAFHKVPHLLIPPVYEARKAVTSLKWAIKEMEKRYRSMSRFGARNLEEFNKKIKDLTSEQLEEHATYNEESIQANRWVETYHYQPLPYIVIVIEEFGDLMTVDKANVEQAVVRLAQMARASGMHLILAMQSPRKDVVTGLIKTNIPGRVSFKVASSMDSRIILDEGGAERLLARGDMLYLAPGVVKPERHHGAWLSEKEISDVMDFWAKQSDPIFDQDAMRLLEGGSTMNPGQLTFDSMGSDDSTELSPDQEERYDEIISWVAQQKDVSASLLQRKFRLGYPRAARMIEIFEAQGVVGPANGSKPRQVLINKLPNP